MVLVKKNSRISRPRNKQGDDSSGIKTYLTKTPVEKKILNIPDQIFDYNKEKGIAVLKGKNGDEVNINVNNMRETLQQLKEYQDVKTEELGNISVEADRKFKNIIEVYRALFEIPELYTELLQIAKEVFNCGTIDNPLVPGTIGAFFCGCADLKDGIECSANCAGNLPHHKEQIFCEYNVFYFDETRKFTFLHEGKNKEMRNYAIIEIAPLISSGFQGFSEDEVKLLETEGIQTIKLRTTENETVKVTHDIPLRNLLREKFIEEKVEKSNTTTVVIILIAVIIILIIICCAGYYMYSKNNGDVEYETGKSIKMEEVN